MKRFYALLLTSLALLLTTTSCHKEKHFITDKEYRAQVHADFLERQELAVGRADALFAGMDTLDAEMREAMEFLYAYMPYSDLADYDQSFYLQQVRAALPLANASVGAARFQRIYSVILCWFIA